MIGVPWIHGGPPHAAYCSATASDPKGFGTDGGSHNFLRFLENSSGAPPNAVADVRSTTAHPLSGRLPSGGPTAFPFFRFGPSIPRSRLSS